MHSPRIVRSFASTTVIAALGVFAASTLPAQGAPTAQGTPATAPRMSPDEIAAFAKLLDELPRPLLAFCRSGARSTRLYLAATSR